MAFVNVERPARRLKRQGTATHNRIMAKQSTPQRPARRIQSVEVGFRVVRALEQAQGPLPLREIARRAAMPASKAHVYLASFLREGLVAQDSGGDYRLGPFAVQLGLSAVRQTDLLGIAWPELEALRAATHCTVYLSVWGNRGPVILAKLDGARQGSLVVAVGYVLPLRRTSTGLAFAAHLPAPEWQALLAAEPAEPGDPRALAATLREVRRQGYATTTHRHIVGMHAIAAPVLDHTGRPAAALTLLGPAEMLSGGPDSAVVRALIGGAARLSLRLGHAPGAAGDDN
jgi:DNA-binding IclR family transcriptional regulator